MILVTSVFLEYDMKKAMMVILALLLVGVLLAKEAIDYDSLELSALLELANNGDAGWQSA